MLNPALAYLTRLFARRARLSGPGGQDVPDERQPLVHTTWHAFDNGKTVGRPGSESGVIVLDEEHRAGARISLERNTCSAPFAITCGVYGALVHTRFFKDEDEARRQFELMKHPLADIASFPSTDDKPTFYKEIETFVARFP